MALRYGLEIRAALAADAPGLSTLLAAAGHTLDERSLADRIATLRGASATALVAGQWGPPRGIVVLHWYPTLAAARPVAQITTLLVAEEERRQGIGRLLVKAAAQAARIAGCGDLEMLVPAAAPALLAFCRASGFIEAGSRFTRSLRKQA